MKKGACQPKPDPDLGAVILLLDIWGEGSLQRIPTPPGIYQECVTMEPLPRPSLLWVGFHYMTDTPGDV